jgi:hypothetical protein
METKREKKRTSGTGHIPQGKESMDNNKKGERG